MIIYLNSKDQEAQDAVLVSAGVCHIIEQPVLDDEGTQVFQEIVVPKEGYTVDTIGVIYALDTSGKTYTLKKPYVPVALKGWHSNIMGEFTDEQLALLPSIATPSHPFRLFAGEV